MLTEREAWEAIAEEWENPSSSSISGRPMGKGGFGLCSSVDNLGSCGLISFETWDEMTKKVPKLNLYDKFYTWSRTLEGAKARAAFCREQAQLLREEGDNP